MTTLIPKFEQTGSTTNRPINLKLSDTVSVLDFGADPTGATDSTTAIQNAINFCQTNKRTLLLNGGTYQTTATLVVNNSYGGGLTIVGEGEGTSVIKANHSGTAVISMIGATNCTLFNFGIVGGLTDTPSVFPKCGIITGRSSANSAGWHTFSKLQVSGSYSVSGIYNIASEGNSWYDLFVICSAPYGVYISGSDVASVGGLTASSMLGANFYNASIYIVSHPISTASVFIQGAIETGQICFFGGYFVSSGGSYVTLDSGSQDGQDSYGPFVFEGINGELTQSFVGTASLSSGTFTVSSVTSGAVYVGMAISGGSITLSEQYYITGFLTGSGGVGTYTVNNSTLSQSSTTFTGYPYLENGFNLTAGETVFLRQLKISNCQLFVSSGNFVYASTNLGLVNSYVQGIGIVQPNVLNLVAPSTFGSNNFYYPKTIPSTGDGNNYNTIVDVGFGARTPTGIAPTLSGAWTNTYGIGNGYGYTGFYCDYLGNVALTGAPGGGAANSTIFTLPVDYRPKTNLLFSVTSNTGGEQVSISTAGVVALIGTGQNPVFLNGIVFPRA